MQWGEDEPALDRCNGGCKFSRFKLQMREPFKDLIDAQVPVLALGPNPIVKGRGIAERKALQKLASREASRPFNVPFNTMLNAMRLSFDEEKIQILNMKEHKDERAFHVNHHL